MNESFKSNSENTPNYLIHEEDSIDIRRHLSLFISNWYWFAIALFISMSFAYGINRWSAKVYTVSSTMLIKDDQNGSITDIFPGSDGFRSQQNVNNEIGILKSYGLNYRVMNELPEFCLTYTSVGKRGIAESRMYKASPFVVLYDSLEKQIKGLKIKIKILSKTKYKLEISGDKNIEKELEFGERFNEQGFDFIIVLRNTKEFTFDQNSSNKFYFYFSDPVIMANQYRNKISIDPIEEGASLVRLTTTGFVPAQEIDYLNTLMKVYLEFGLEYKNQTAAQTINFIENQLSSISDSLKIAENDLESFRLYNKLIDISREGTIIQDKLEQIDDERTKLTLQKKYYEYLQNYIELKRENDDIIAPSAMGVTDQLLIRLVDELSGLQKQKQMLAINLYESAEPLKIIENRLMNTRRAIQQNISDGNQNIERSISDVERRLKNIENEIIKLPTTERQMINIQRKFDINNTVYTFLLEKRAEAGISKASNIPDNRIIDHAGFFNSAMIKPRQKRNIILALLFGLLAPLCSIVFIDYFNNKIIDKKDIEKGTSAPLIGYISHNTKKSELAVMENSGSTLSESFRSVRTNLKYFLKDAPCPVISISSTISSEGKTFVSANLASILAMSNKKVLLVGLDLRKPRIHKVFGINNESGMSNYLIGDEKFENVIFKTEVDNLWYASSGPVPPNPAELIESDYMKDFIEKAKNQFDYIVIDTPPVAIVTDALLVSSFTDFYLFVVRQRYSSKNTLELIEELYKNDAIKNLGVVINDINQSGYYGYGLRYGYSFGYGYKYGYNYYTQYGKYGYSDSAKGYYKDI